ncbi:MAG: hypothetical protein JRN06_08625 [Nitrososphaerota archaeon]|nr:hypothetical protein [Nitrososphaerota archaeon]
MKAMQNFKNLLVSAILVALTVTSAIPYASSYSQAGQVTLLATSRENLFVGAVAGGGYLYVGLLNGSIEKMNPQSGLAVAILALPDRNSAAHLLYYNGSLYVGTEFLRGAKNTAPYHIYRIDPRTMQVRAQLPMQGHDANGFVFEFKGYLWSGDGLCTLLKITPDTLSVVGRVPNVAEDEMIYDGTYFWTECRNAVSVLKSDSLTVVATGALPPPGRPRGFFEVGSNVYSMNSADFTLYRMSVSGDKVVFENRGTLGNHALGTRDTFSKNGLLYVYETSDNASVQASISVYDVNFNLKAVIALPGYGLPPDASQHSMFLLNGMIYYVTASSIGYFAPLDGHTLSNISTSVLSASTFISSSPNNVSIDWRLLIVLMVAIGVTVTAVYLRRAKAIQV